MVSETEKRSRKAKATRKANLLKKAAENEKLRRAKARATKAETTLKAYKEGFKDGINSKRGDL